MWTMKWTSGMMAHCLWNLIDENHFLVTKEKYSKRAIVVE
jgi:hypothetical protein